MIALLSLAGLLMAGCGSEETPADGAADRPPASALLEPSARVPEWATDAVFYQIFPTRFANGDPSNDPTRETLERPIEDVPASWSTTPWTSDWYAEADWERQMGDFYESVYDRRYGGDLQGVIDRLPYLDSLGVNALYLNPVFWARSLHKYDGISFHHVDPHFGPDPAGDKALIEEENPTDPDTWRTTAADSLFLSLLEAAHARDIRVVIDGVFNHTGRDFFAFQDLVENQAGSRFADWYRITAFDDPATTDTSEFEYEGWWGVPQLPEFADTDDGTDLAAGPKQYVFDITRRWMDPNGDGDPSDGIDGWRLDVADEVPESFWQDWNAHVRSINPAAYTVAETWQPAAEFVQAGGFSAVMNYFAFALPVKAFLIDHSVDASTFTAMLDARRTAFEPETRGALQNLVDSHDTPRLATMLVNRSDTGYVQPDRFDYDWGEVVSLRQNPSYAVRAPGDAERHLQRLVTLFQMTYVGAPMLYYGTEAGMWGADDPDDRKPMVWPDLDYATEDDHPFGHDRPADPVAYDDALADFYRRAIALRRDTPALRRGTYTSLLADDARSIVAFARGMSDDAAVVVLNRSADAHSIRIPLPDTLRAPYETVLVTREPVRVQQDAAALLVELPPFGGLALRSE